jgi:hypothetical protein
MTADGKDLRTTATVGNALGYILSDDLLFTSRAAGTARAQGLDFKVARSADALLALARQQPPTGVLVDLANPGLIIEELVVGMRALKAPPRLIGYGSHVDTAMLKRARDAGCDIVLPRSKFVDEMPVKLADWLRPQSASQK